MPQCTATYSPDDNKLRLYPATRLDADTYARVKAAGFIWAPKQECFVAGAWTPEREDVAIELAGEIDDDDRSLVERAEERAERFAGYEERRRDESETTAARSQYLAELMNGQPILVGHHSEKRHRRDLDRVFDGMRRSAHLWRTAEYWQRRASAAIQHARYKERPDVRARRIRTIDAEKRKQERYRTQARNAVRVWTSPTHPLTRERAQRIANLDHGYYERQYQHASGYVGPRTYADALTDPSVTPEQVRDVAVQQHQTYLARCDRWIEHFDRRLEYERAMLAADDGTVADRTRPEKGGAVRCWVDRSRWLVIQKVNTISVTVFDNWGNGGPDFPRTVPFDKLAEVMTRAHVEAARAAGRVQGETARGFVLADVTPTEARA